MQYYEEAKMWSGLPNKKAPFDKTIETVVLNHLSELYDRRCDDVMVVMRKLAEDGLCPVCRGKLVSPEHSYCDLCGWTHVMLQEALTNLILEVYELGHRQDNKSIGGENNEEEEF